MALDVFKEWMERSSPADKKRLAKASGINFLYLYEIASGRRICSSEIAGKVEVAIQKMNKKGAGTGTLTNAKLGTGTLPCVTRGDLSPVCRKCPYFKGSDQ